MTVDRGCQGKVLNGCSCRIRCAQCVEPFCFCQINLLISLRLKRQFFMPTTYNGIGLHYYGKKNVQKRSAPCPHCGNAVELISYDTRLWFVVVFIPVIPLKRKRIVDYCPACTR